MAYQFIDGYGSILTADSSVISGSGVSGTIRPLINIGSVLSVIPTTAGSGVTSLVSTIPSSVLVGASIFGLPPVNVTNTNLNVGGSVVGFQGGAWAASIVGAPIKTEDAGHATGDQGLFVLGVRNDTVASFVSADLDYSPITTDSAGRALVRPFAAEEARVEGYASLVSTSVTTLVAAAGTGLRNYITDFWVANTGATTTLITFKDGVGSILGYTIAPTVGGSNSPGIATPIRTGANASFDFQPTSASSILFVTVKGFKAP